LPPYLDRVHFAAVRENASRVSVHHVSMTDHLAAAPAASYDR
jgi:S-adenosylmethionine-diacylglycerol 3-amino-3-carboxypropyl transferase